MKPQGECLQRAPLRAVMGYYTAARGKGKPLQGVGILSAGADLISY